MKMVATKTKMYRLLRNMGFQMPKCKYMQFTHLRSSSAYWLDGIGLKAYISVAGGRPFAIVNEQMYKIAMNELIECEMVKE